MIGLFEDLALGSAYMIVNTKDMIGVPVLTKSGAVLGKVASFDLEQETGRLLALHVKARGFVHGLMADEFMLAWTQIIEMTPQRVLVADGAVKTASEARATLNPRIQPASMAAHKEL